MNVVVNNSSKYDINDPKFKMRVKMYIAPTSRKYLHFVVCTNVHNCNAFQKWKPCLIYQWHSWNHSLKQLDFPLRHTWDPHTSCNSGVGKYVRPRATFSLYSFLAGHIYRSKRLYQCYKKWSPRAGCGPRVVCCPLIIVLDGSKILKMLISRSQL